MGSIERLISLSYIKKKWMDMLRIMKFGGTSVGDSEKIKHVAGLVKKYKEEETVIVTSAMAGVTDELLVIAEKVARGISEEEIKNMVGTLREKHALTAKESISSEFLEIPLISIEKLCHELERVLIGVSYVGELTSRSLDYIISFGERLCAPILSGALNTVGVKSKWFTGYEAGITTDSNFGKASPVWEITNKKITEILKPKLKEYVPVVTGFIAGDEKGRITTLGRGGSDYSAAILGAALDAGEIWIWTDVNGIMTTDPKLVSNARTIKLISYIEAMELAYFGAKVLHPKTIEPAMEKGIPVRVRNTFNPENEGTLIVKEREKIEDIVKAVSVMEGVVMLNISGAGMIGMPGVVARVFKALATGNINILMISQASSEANISFVILKEDLKKALEVLSTEFRNNYIKQIDYLKDIAIIAVVGAGMIGTKGVAARVFKAVADAGVNIIMIAQGSSEVNISFVILEKDAKKAAEALHKEFIG